MQNPNREPIHKQICLSRNRETQRPWLKLVPPAWAIHNPGPTGRHDMRHAPAGSGLYCARSRATGRPSDASYFATSGPTERASRTHDWRDEPRFLSFARWYGNTNTHRVARITRIIAPRTATCALRTVAVLTSN